MIDPRPLPAHKYHVWETLQEPHLPNAFRLYYHDFQNHPLWVSDRKDFSARQWQSGQSCFQQIAGRYVLARTPDRAFYNSLLPGFTLASASQKDVQSLNPRGISFNPDTLSK